MNPLPPLWLALQSWSPEADQPSHPQEPPHDEWLGTWALRWSPRVARLHEVWVVEVSTTLRLWGGWPALWPHMLQPVPCSDAAPSVHVAVGPSALAALARLRAGECLPQHAAQPTDTQALLKLPLYTLDAARPHAAVLARLGVRSWGQLRRLPRQGVARRWGGSLLQALDQALGLLPETHRWLQPAPEFDMALEWPHHLDTTPALMAPAQQLLAALLGWLMQRQRGVLALRWSWAHDPRRNVPLHGGFDLHTAQPSQSLAHLQRLTAEHMARQTLAAPVVSLRLQTLVHAPFALATTDLLSTRPPPDASHQPLSWTELLERLSARLGDHAVITLHPANDHRPEHMQSSLPARTGAMVAGTLTSRTPATGTTSEAGNLSVLLPTWLLAQPLPLSLRGNRPCYQGELQLLAGPQRLETTHWPCVSQAAATDGLLSDPTQPELAVQRDYFVARSPRAGLLWVFRLRPTAHVLTAEAEAGTPPKAASRHGPSWFLHGVFA